MAENVLQDPGDWLPRDRRGMEESHYGNEHLCLCDHPCYVLGPYDRVLRLCHGFPPWMVIHRVWSLLCDRCPAFWHGSCSHRLVPAPLHDETLQVFHSTGTLQYDWHVDAAGFHGMGVFLLQ